MEGCNVSMMMRDKNRLVTHDFPHSELVLDIGIKGLCSKKTRGTREEGV